MSHSLAYCLDSHGNPVIIAARSVMRMQSASGSQLEVWVLQRSNDCAKNPKRQLVTRVNRDVRLQARSYLSELPFVLDEPMWKVADRMCHSLELTCMDFMPNRSNCGVRGSKKTNKYCL